MINNKKREAAQKRAVELSDKYNRLQLRWATGYGKTRAAILIALSKDLPIDIVCHRVNHIDGWKREFLKCIEGGVKGVRNEVRIFTYRSLHKYVDEYERVLILDECVHFTERNKEQLMPCKNYFKYVIGLAAVVSNKRHELLTSIFGSFHVDTISVKQAQEDKSLPNFKVTLLKFRLDNTEKSKKFYTYPRNPRKGSLTRVCYTLQEALKYSYKYNVHMYLNDQEYYNFLSSKIDDFVRLSKEKKFPKQIYLNLGAERKNFLSNCYSKLLILKAILRKVKNKKTLFFLGGTESLEKLFNPDQRYYYKNSKENNKQVLENFRNDRFKHLGSINALEEGVSIYGIKTLIISQIDGLDREETKSISYEQRIGRALRQKDINAVPHIVILIAKNTIDEKYLYQINIENNEEVSSKSVKLT